MNLVIAGTGQPFLLQIVNSYPSGCLNLLGFIDDNADNRNRNLQGYSILGGFDWIRGKEDIFLINSIARTCKLRQSSTQRLTGLGAKYINLVDHSIDLKPVHIGIGNIIAKNVVIEPGVQIGNHNVLLSGTVIAHDTCIGDFNFFGLNSIIQGNCSIGSTNFFSAGVIVEPSLSIGSNCLVSAGAVVHRNIDSSKFVFRLPDRLMRLPNFSKHAC
jgi:sugar O-acyltransferase (sialic acid O-acetyltransferase NeuD family)